MLEGERKITGFFSSSGSEEGYMVFPQTSPIKVSPSGGNVCSLTEICVQSAELIQTNNGSQLSWHQVGKDSGGTMAEILSMLHLQAHVLVGGEHY